MAGNVLPSIETDDDLSFANGSVYSDDTYTDDGTPKPEDPEGRLMWGRKHNGEDWYLREVASREAGRKAQREREERWRIEEEEVEAIRRLRETDPWEYGRQMREYNLRLAGCTQEQIDKSNQPLSKEDAEKNWAAFSALLQGKVLEPVTTGKHADVRSSTARDRTIGNGKRSKRPASKVAKVPRASSATNVKPPQSKHHETKQRKISTAERTSRRLAHKTVEYGIFADPSPARPVPKSLQRNPLTRKRSVEAAKPQRISKSGREGTRRSRHKKQSGR